MWTLQTTDEYLSDAKWFQKPKNKRLNEFKAVHLNLDRYFEALNQGTKPKQIQGGWIHAEPLDVVALDQKCPKPKDDEKFNTANLAETRLYVFPDPDTRVVHVLRLGGKSEQPDQIKYCKKYVSTLMERKKKQGKENATTGNET